MKLSRLRDRQLGGEERVVAQQFPQDAGASAGQGDELSRQLGLDVFAALAALLEVEVAVGPFADDARLRGHVEHAAQASAVALGAVWVAGPAAGATWHGHEDGSGGEVVASV